MRKYALMGLGVLLSLTGCSSVVAPTGGPGIEGTWDVQQIDAASPVTGSSPTMTFASGQLSGSTGCNRFTGTYTTKSASQITIASGALTAMACADALMQQETDFIQAMAKVTSYSITGDTALLQDSTGKVQFTLRRQPVASPSPLQGTTWSLTSIHSGGTVSSVVSGSEVTVQLTDGTISGKACNTFRGKATIDGSNLTVGPLATTRMACPSEDLTQQENAVVDTLGKVKTFAIEGGTLTLSTADGDGLDFTAK